MGRFQCVKCQCTYESKRFFWERGTTPEAEDALEKNQAFENQKEKDQQEVPILKSRWTRDIRLPTNMPRRSRRRSSLRLGNTNVRLKQQHLLRSALAPLAQRSPDGENSRSVASPNDPHTAPDEPAGAAETQCLNSSGTCSDSREAPLRQAPPEDAPLCQAKSDGVDSTLIMTSCKLDVMPDKSAGVPEYLIRVFSRSIRVGFSHVGEAPPTSERRTPEESNAEFDEFAAVPESRAPSDSTEPLSRQASPDDLSSKSALSPQVSKAPPQKAAPSKSSLTFTPQLAVTNGASLESENAKSWTSSHCKEFLGEAPSQTVCAEAIYVNEEEEKIEEQKMGRRKSAPIVYVKKEEEKIEEQKMGRRKSVPMQEIAVHADVVRATGTAANVVGSVAPLGHVMLAPFSVLGGAVGVSAGAAQLHEGLSAPSGTVDPHLVAKGAVTTGVGTTCMMMGAGAAVFPSLFLGALAVGVAGLGAATAIDATMDGLCDSCKEQVDDSHSSTSSESSTGGEGWQEWLAGKWRSFQ